MIEPVRQDLKLYKGADFLFKFRFKTDGAYLDLTGCTVFFNASNKADGTNEFSLSSSDSPETITIDEADNYLVAIKIDADDTALITEPELYYEIDLLDSGGIRSRWINGVITVYGDAA